MNSHWENFIQSEITGGGCALLFSSRREAFVFGWRDETAPLLKWWRSPLTTSRKSMKHLQTTQRTQDELSNGQPRVLNQMHVWHQDVKDHEVVGNIWTMQCPQASRSRHQHLLCLLKLLWHWCDAPCSLTRFTPSLIQFTRSALCDTCAQHFRVKNSEMSRVLQVDALFICSCIVFSLCHKYCDDKVNKRHILVIVAASVLWWHWIITHIFACYFKAVADYALVHQSPTLLNSSPIRWISMKSPPPCWLWVIYFCEYCNYKK